MKQFCKCNFLRQRDLFYAGCWLVTIA